MGEKTSWDWHTELKEVPVKEWESRFNWVQAPRVSRDGERIAAIVNLDEMAFNVCVNGDIWEDEYEKVWCLTPYADKGFAAFVAKDEEWTMNVDGTEWSNWFDFLWDMKISPNGDFIGAAFQTDSEYGMVVNDVPWEDRYENISGAVMAPNGISAAVVQMASMAAADVDAFKKGIFSIACNGKARAARFLNAWDISFDKAAQNIACTVRLDREAYTIVQNDTVWDNRFESAWKAAFLDEKTLVAPVRSNGKWQLYKNNTPFWAGAYDQLWHLAVSPAGEEIAAIVSTPYGRWTVAVNDRMWQHSWDTMVSDIHFSRDGSCLAAVYKHKGAWDLAVNQTPWQMGADKVFVPSISPDGSVVAVVVEKNSTCQLVVNNRVMASCFSFMADPVISPDGAQVMLKAMENGVYKRQIFRV